MKNAVHKIYDGESDANVHSDFIKFSKGVFDNRYVLEGKKQSSKWSVKTSSEFANFFVAACLSKIEGKISLRGAIICTYDLRDEIEVEKVKQFAGVKQHLIENEVEADKIKKLMEKHPRAFYALSFNSGDFELKIKAKPPKSGKPGKKGDDEPKADFCSLKTRDYEIVKDLFFDYPNFNEIKIRHTIEIKEIEIPKGISDPKEIRERSIRKGVLKRFVEVDGVKKESEKEFRV